MLDTAQRIEQLKKQGDKGVVVTGPVEIAGEVRVQSSKNSTMKLVVAAVAVPGVYVLRDFPQIVDPLETLRAVEYIGGSVAFSDDGSVRIDTTSVQNRDIPYSYTKKTTSAFGLAGVLLGRFGSVSIGKPGGDELGPRPVDLHCDGFRTLGEDVEDLPELVKARWTEAASISSDAIPRFDMRMAATGVSVNYVLAVVGRRTRAYLGNPALDGDMQAMYALLRQVGVVIELREGALYIDATQADASAHEIEFNCWPDRNDAFTWLAYGALSAKGLTITNVKLDDLTAALPVLRSLGVLINEQDESTLFVKAPQGPIPSGEVEVVAGIGEQFHSDWGPLLQVVATQIQGRVRVIETLFSHRVRQADLLGEMGARVTVRGGEVPEGVNLYFRDNPNEARYQIEVEGPSKLRSVTASIGNDVRACAALVMAASQAEGVSHLTEVSALYRGYEDIVNRLCSIGVDIAAEAVETDPK